MNILIMIISILLIALVLLQSGKAESGAGALTGTNDSLFSNRKERGGELFITRLTYTLGLSFMLLSFVISIIS